MTLRDDATWKDGASREPQGYLSLRTEDTGEVPVRLFLRDALFAELDEAVYRQIVAATRFPGVRCVVVTPDVHVGYGVPVGCVIATDRNGGAVALGPVGFDIGCGMLSARSPVPAEAATPTRRLAFHREVMKRVSLGKGGRSIRFGALSEEEFGQLVRGATRAYAERYGQRADWTRMESSGFPVDEDWSIPFGGPGFPERGLDQLGSLGGGNHFIELQRAVSAAEEPSHAREGLLHVQIHTGSRGFGHGLATNYFARAQTERPELGAHLDLGYFTPDSPNFRGYQNAVAAGANYAALNRLVIFEEVSEAFERVFGEPLELVYDISHNLVQAETHPEFGEIWVHRKGATRAFPKGHQALQGTPFFEEGHPVLVPGSNGDHSVILRPRPGALASLYSVNHGAGRRLSRGDANRVLDQSQVNEDYRRVGILVNDDGRVPLDESAACYKPMKEVVGTITELGLAEVETRLWPLGSLKGVEGSFTKEKRERGAQRKEREKSRQAARRARGK